LVKKKRKSLDERICAFLYYSITALWYYGECIVTEVWMRGNNMVSVLIWSRVQGGVARSARNSVSECK